MAIRDLTRQFNYLREQNSPVQSEKSALLDDFDQNVWTHGSARVERSNEGQSLPPVWVDHLDQIKTTLNGIEKDIERLKGKQEERLKFRFDDARTEQDRDIEVLTQTITTSFQRGNQILKKIAIIGNETGKLPYQERVVRVNVMRAMATRSQKLSKLFREQQTVFLDSLQKGGRKLGQFFDDDERLSVQLGDVGVGLSDKQILQLEKGAQDADQREKEIISIAKSVNDLAQLFNELNVLVVQQGTIMDRIDFNIEQTVGQIRKAGQELRKAEKYQKRSLSTACIIVLLVGIIICACIIVFKNIT